MEQVVIDGIIALFAAAAFLLSLIQLIINLNRGKKESTLKAYRELQEDSISKVRDLKDKIPTIQKDSKEWEILTRCLVDLENFCVGINEKIYDIRVLNRLGGGYFIYLYSILEPIINEKRKDTSSKHYDEFESTVKHLKAIREKSKKEEEKQKNTGKDA